jgi:hypothetical protein
MWVVVWDNAGDDYMMFTPNDIKIRSSDRVAFIAGTHSFNWELAPTGDYCFFVYMDKYGNTANLPKGSLVHTLPNIYS